MTVAYMNKNDSTELYATDNLWDPFPFSSRIKIEGVNHLSLAHYENHWKTKNPSKINIIDLTTNAPEQLNVDFKVILRYNHPLYPVVIKA